MPVRRACVLFLVSCPNYWVLLAVCFNIGMLHQHVESPCGRYPGTNTNVPVLVACLAMCEALEAFCCRASFSAGGS